MINKQAGIKSKQSKKALLIITMLIAILGGGLYMISPPLRTLSMFLLAQKFLVGLSFYGKVVDQNQQPVSGAMVKVRVKGGGPFAQGQGDGDYKTDKEGIFHVKGKGQAIQIVKIEHPELSAYISKFGPNQSTWLGGYDDRTFSGNWTEHRARENPYVLQVWRETKWGKVYQKDYITFTPPRILSFMPAAESRV